jgi:hypothetical protein
MTRLGPHGPISRHQTRRPTNRHPRRGYQNAGFPIRALTLHVDVDIGRTAFAVQSTVYSPQSAVELVGPASNASLRPKSIPSPLPSFFLFRPRLLAQPQIGPHTRCTDPPASSLHSSSGPYASQRSGWPSRTCAAAGRLGWLPPPLSRSTEHAVCDRVTSVVEHQPARKNPPCPRIRHAGPSPMLNPIVPTILSLAFRSKPASLPPSPSSAGQTVSLMRMRTLP